MNSNNVIDASGLALKRELENAYVLENISLSMNEGDFHIVLGPNGAGKSTLLKLISGDIKPTKGEIVFNGKKLNNYSINELSHKRAVLPQLNSFLFPMSVYEVCALGRTPYMGARLGIEDKKAINEALGLLELESYKDKDYSNLSGGEQQRVQIARILAQETAMLFLDEPLSALDIRHQIKLLDLLSRFSCEGKTILCVMHDINLALRYATHLTFLKKGRVLFQGRPTEIQSAEVFEDVYDIKASLLEGDVPQIEILGTS